MRRAGGGRLEIESHAAACARDTEIDRVTHLLLAYISPSIQNLYSSVWLLASCEKGGEVAGLFTQSVREVTDLGHDSHSRTKRAQLL